MNNRRCIPGGTRRLLRSAYRMFDEIDEAIRQLLSRELPIRNNEIDIAFDLPKREWSARLSRPTLNLYLYDVRENIKMRQMTAAWETTSNGSTATTRRGPVRVDLTYMVSAWATQPDDEHRLLGRLMQTMLRFPTVPDDLLPEAMKAQKLPVALQMAQPDILDKPTELWGVLSNDLRPGIGLRVTMAVNPYAATTAPIVKTSDVRFDQRDGAGTSPAGNKMMVRGLIRGAAGAVKPRVMLVERGMEALVRASDEGVTEFAFFDMIPGEYTLEFTADGRKATRKRIVVPALSYDIDA